MTLAHDRTGSGEPLVLIHGFGAHRQLWRLAVELLAPHRDVINLDVPGFGDSPADVDDPTPPRLAHRVADFMDGLGLERAHVAGYSMGGWIALELNKLGRTLSTCAICPAGFWNHWERAWCRESLRVLRASARAGGARMEPLYHNPKLRRALTLQQMEHADRLSAEEIIAATRNLATSPGFDATYDALHRGHFTGASDVRAPVTVAWGDKDKLLLPRQADRARRAMPQARHLWLPGCGHHPMVDDPEATVRAILTSA
jgi:pimeloyl-ACP methyl ester carboxylesterase